MNKKKRDLVKIKFGGKCAYTGKPLGDDWQVDHILSRSKVMYSRFSGMEERLQALSELDNIDNLYPACGIVNHYKRSLDLEGFRKYMLQFHLRLSKLPKNTNCPRAKKRKEYMFKVAELFDITPDKPFSGKFYFELITQTSN